MIEQHTLQSSKPKWALHRRLYDWILSLAHYKHANWALLFLSCAESSVFPLAPDILQIAMTLEKRQNAWIYALINMLGSVMGGIIGYMIGSYLWELCSSFFLTYVFSAVTFIKVGQLYHQWDFWVVFVGAFTPIPYKVITIAAGVFDISLPMFIIASLMGRGGRFFLVAALLHRCGPSIKDFIDKYFNLVSIALVAVLLIGFLILKLIA